MKDHVRIFPELGGFAIFCESLLVQELDLDLDLLNRNSDLLSYLSNSSDSEDIIKKGLIFPINEIEDGLYTIYLEEGNILMDKNLSPTVICQCVALAT
ncbi:hypothetical protein VIBNISO65_1540030 [Vibrio nigripulchritudo SO65]|uniref:hypothetical protein n=1 Tax=Vibrio nigripulchritudo TaxID=28173 RepID=UPI0003B1DDDC|nr:hypothetical protein [Vibrio nigripulchritudo]CCN33788.1 hypothetical protein VIBNIAM115_1270005 [Vibrio nigripulchritudo AM115]CCN44882.1 hypothetical protein VIBNIFTn2_980006 [Vibrio nigripulchritudo FTn2]CCN65695.1 hypothetical protein VIBNIPon4_420030 [Vibrio nigripulchritudo POn4]CCN76260.1 hypothetical protein VIBNISO65_1540030 [Vibrio nigripulchritudo SO65]